LDRLCTPDLAITSMKVPSVEVPGAGRGLLNNRLLLEQRLFMLPGTIIEDVRIFARPVGLAARYLMCWQSRSGKLHRLAGALNFYF
ncbi:MAG TPA: hypothetical protein VH590_04895, partial [Ktedonobacterales bacterium]